MSGRKAKAAQRNQTVAAQAPAQQWFSWRSIGLAAGVVAVVIVAIVLLGRRDSGSSSPPATARGASGTPFAVGAPGPGRLAPAITLPSTSGSTFDLASYRGKQQVLLYFQEGLTCQPCWDQIAAIEQQLAAFKALGIGPIVSVTTDRLDLISQKARDEGFSMPVLSDPDARVSDAYDARTYSMTWMKPLRDGHSFILVGKDGRIRWRADYGGPPRYTMFLPVDALLADLRQGIGKQA